MSPNSHPGRLEKLAERCEAATGPDRELDVEIARTQGGKTAKDIEDLLVGSPLNTIEVIASCADGPYFTVPRYTDSLDAAWTLLPGDDISLTKEGPDDWVADLTCLTPDAWSRDEEYELYRRGKTPALALCAAALRARAVLTPPSEPTEK